MEAPQHKFDKRSVSKSDAAVLFSEYIVNNLIIAFLHGHFSDSAHCASLLLNLAKKVPFREGIAPISLSFGKGNLVNKDVITMYYNYNYIYNCSYILAIIFFW